MLFRSQPITSRKPHTTSERTPKMSSSPHSRQLAVAVVTGTAVAIGGLYYSQQGTKNDVANSAETDGSNSKEAAKLGSGGVVDEMQKTKLPGKPSSERSLRG